MVYPLTLSSPVSFAILAIIWSLWVVIRKTLLNSTLRDLPGPPRSSWITGNLAQLFNPGGLAWHDEMVKRYGRAFRIYGWFGDEQVYVTDAEALKYIILKDQHVYEETSAFLATTQLCFGNGLLSVLGDHHRRQRKLLNPVFSVAHLRNLPPILYKITYQLRDVLTKQVENGAREIDMSHWMSRATLEYVGQAGLGYSFDTFDEKKPNEYTLAIKGFAPALFKMSMFRQFLPFVMKLGPPGFRSFLIDVIPWKNLQKLKHIVQMMHNTSIEVYQAKKAALVEGEEIVARQIGGGKDLMTVLLRENAKSDEADRLPDEEVYGQMSTLIFAAQDTTSSALSRILHTLTLHPEAQAKLREEVTAAQHERGDLTYDELMALPYMDAVVRESLRLYATFTIAIRTTRRDIVLPLGTPIKSADGRKDIHKIFLKNNTNVIVGLGTANRDPTIWGEDAHVWKPGRWIGKAQAEVVKVRLPGVYSGMMTFLGGSRACIGFKLAELEIKLMLAVLLPTFVFELPDDVEIIWRNSSLATPTTKGKETAPPHMPLRVSLMVVPQ